MSGTDSVNGAPRGTVRAAAFGSLLILTVMLAGCAGAPDTAEEPVDPAVVAELQRVQAEEDQKLLVAAEEDLRYGRAELALQRLTGLGEPLRSSPRARLALAEASLGTGRSDTAYALFQSLLDDPTYRAQALQGLGLTELARGRDEAAGELLRQAVASDASLWRAWNALGRYHDLRREWHDAENAYGKALVLRPDDPSVLNNLGISYSQQGRHQEAEGMFRQALRIDPGERAAEANLRLAIAWQGRYAEALNGVSQSDAPDALNNVGYIAMMNGDYATAERLLMRALEISPTYHADAQSNLDRLRALQGAPGISQPTSAEE